MLIRIEKRQHITKSNQRWTYSVCIFQCDQCSKEFERRGANNGKHKSIFHFCSKECGILSRKKGGMLNKHVETVCLEKYGVITPLTSNSCIEKGKKTSYDKFGVSDPRSSEFVKKKREETNIRIYGKSTFLATDENRTILRTKEVREHIHAVLKRNGTYGKSKIEDRFYNALIDQFGIVERQVNINGWLIDFYVKSIDTYIQFDGVYWHGLDRNLEEICKFVHKRDRVIYNKFLTDRKQDNWFKKSGFRLVRITDKQFMASTFDITRFS